jgi:hypothetical protein
MRVDCVRGYRGGVAYLRQMLKVWDGDNKGAVLAVRKGAACAEDPWGAYYLIQFVDHSILRQRTFVVFFNWSLDQDE